MRSGLGRVLCCEGSGGCHTAYPLPLSRDVNDGGVDGLSEACRCAGHPVRKSVMPSGQARASTQARETPSALRKTIPAPPRGTCSFTRFILRKSAIHSRLPVAALQDEARHARHPLPVRERLARPHRRKPPPTFINPHHPSADRLTKARRRLSWAARTTSSSPPRSSNSSPACAEAAACTNASPRWPRWD